MELPCLVLIYFGAPIVPRSGRYDGGPEVQDPPLNVDELPGWLDAWQKSPQGWRGMVTCRYPVHGFGTCLRFIDWFPAGRLRLVPD